MTATNRGRDADLAELEAEAEDCSHYDDMPAVVIEAYETDLADTIGDLWFLTGDDATAADNDTLAWAEDHGYDGAEVKYAAYPDAAPEPEGSNR
jgi:hypothetical protein